MKLWATSDTHYSHANIIKYCSRPFGAVWEMNKALAERWCARVAPDDVVIHLGDVTLMRKPHQDSGTLGLLRGLPGRVLLVAGNHDSKPMLDEYRGWGWRVAHSVPVGDVLLVHVPPPQMPAGVTLVLHGHTHSQRHRGDFNRPGYIDLGVDAQPDYAPVDLGGLLPAVQHDAVLTRVLNLLSTAV